MTRSRSYTWGDPMKGAQAARQMTGLEYLRACMVGEVSIPIAETLDFSMDEVEEGRVVFRATPAEYHYNPIGTVHGGFAATLLDSAAACAIHSTLAQGVGYTTVQLNVNYVRPMDRETGTVRCIGEVVHVGRSLATSEARIVDDAGKVYAHATSTCMVFTP